MLASCLAALAFATVAPPPAPLDNRGYLAVADRIQSVFEPLWDERAGHYQLGGGGVAATTNGNLLLVHSVAALRGHDGPARQDARARRMVGQLLESPPYAGTLPPRLDASSQWHAPGWVSSMTTLRAGQHVMVDAEVVDGLVHAWLARRSLGLSAEAARLIGRRIHAVAMSRFWRWPNIRLNQFNWYARIYSADAIVTGRSRLVRRDLRRQIARFTSGVDGASGRAGNLGPGLRFHYLPHRPRRSAMNFDSPEYANMVASFTRFYSLARRHGMAPIVGAERRLVRRWLRRVVTGYWTHAGYLNWDTGLGFRRWHQAKKLGLAQHGLIGIASTPALAAPRTRDWAKWILDQGFAFYGRQAPSGLGPGVFFGVSMTPQSLGSARLAAARMAGNAARAVAAGLGRARTVEPPPLFSFDRDTGRLAVSTPAYNTAVVPVSQGAFPYGGIELARLYDGRQEVAAGIGGRPPAAFGVVVRDRSGRRRLASQLARRELGGRPLRVTGVRGTAGSFRSLRAAGVVRSAGLVARTRHRFRAGFIETRWTVRGARDGDTVEVLFPSWGGRHARVVAVGVDGSRTVLGRRALTGVAYLHVQSARSGYVVVVRRPAGVRARTRRARRQSSAPHPGPTLALRPAGARLAVRLAPARGATEAEAVAARLRAR
jgi:hypothetical protein